MELTSDQITEINEALERLQTLDPADLPQPAADLVALLSTLLEETDRN